MKWPLTLGLCLASALAAWLANGWRLGAELNRAKATYSERVAKAEAATAAAERTARAEEARRTEAMQEVQRVAALSRARDAADRRVSDATGERVRAAARAAAAGASPADPSPADGGAPAAGPGLVLADLFGGADEAAGELAAALDAARTAGLACERAYDALTAGPRPGEPAGQVSQ